MYIYDYMNKNIYIYIYTHICILVSLLDAAAKALETKKK